MSGSARRFERLASDLKVAQLFEGPVAKVVVPFGNLQSSTIERGMIAVATDGTLWAFDLDREGWIPFPTRKLDE